MIRFAGAVDDPDPVAARRGGPARADGRHELALGSLAGRRASSKSYPGARHEIFNETNQDEVLDDVIAFIRANLPARGAR